MMFPPNFTRQPEFQAFKALINHPAALEFLFNLSSRCQVEKKVELHLPVEYIAPTLGFADETLDSSAVRDALIKFGMLVPIEGKKDMFQVKLFTDHNSQLRACWNNGKLGGRRPREQLEEDRPF